MNFGGVKRRQADILFSKWLRKLRGYRCEKCGTVHSENSKNLGVSHFWPRSMESVRFDERNCEILCNIPCHRFFEEHRTEYENWKCEDMGEQEFKKLTVDAHTLQKRDDAKVLLFLKNQ